jgi:hypothetical protein
VTLFLTLSTPLLAFAGALLGVVLNRRAARELESRSRREETMRNLRWAADHAVDPDPKRAALGSVQLEALGRWSLVDVEQRLFVDAALSLNVLGVDEWD